MKNPYEILGVSQAASMEEICEAYNNLAAEYDPDKLAGNPLAHLAEERFKEINAAYEELRAIHNNPSHVAQPLQVQAVLKKKGFLIGVTSMSIIIVVLLIFTVLIPWMNDNKKVNEVEGLIGAIRLEVLSGGITFNKSDLKVAGAAYDALGDKLQGKVENKNVLFAAIENRKDAKSKAKQKRDAIIQMIRDDESQDSKVGYGNGKVDISDKGETVEVKAYAPFKDYIYLNNDGTKKSDKKARKSLKKTAQYYANMLESSIIITDLTADGIPRITASAAPKKTEYTVNKMTDIGDNIDAFREGIYGTWKEYGSVLTLRDDGTIQEKHINPKGKVTANLKGTYKIVYDKANARYVFTVKFDNKKKEKCWFTNGDLGIYIDDKGALHIYLMRDWVKESIYSS